MRRRRLSIDICSHLSLFKINYLVFLHLLSRSQIDFVKKRISVIAFANGIMLIISDAFELVCDESQITAGPGRTEPIGSGKWLFSWYGFLNTRDHLSFDVTNLFRMLGKISLKQVSTAI